MNLRSLNRFAGVFEKVGGALLVVVGLMMLTGQFTRLATFFFSVMPEWLRL